MGYAGKWYEFINMYPDKLEVISNKFWITGNDVKRVRSEWAKQQQLTEFTNLSSVNDLNEPMTASGRIWYDDGYPWKLRIADGITFGCSMLIGYLLMLIAMTYNCGYFIAICAGFVAGRIIFYGQSKNL